MASFDCLHQGTISDTFLSIFPPQSCLARLCEILVPFLATCYIPGSMFCSYPVLVLYILVSLVYELLITRRSRILYHSDGIERVIHDVYRRVPCTCQNQLQQVWKGMCLTSHDAQYPILDQSRISRSCISPHLSCNMDKQICVTHSPMAWEFELVACYRYYDYHRLRHHCRLFDVCRRIVWPKERTCSNNRHHCLVKAS
jgi:hypothetical protein